MSTTTLFTPLKVGTMELSNRICMAPLTRFRADKAHVHQDVAVEYYTQRCQTPGTMIITEATFISPAAGGYPNVPGIYTPDQIAAWKRIVDAVHAKGCFITMQLWALGRAAVGDVLAAEGVASGVVSASNVPIPGSKETPRAITTEEIKQYTADYAQAAHNFIVLAGGDAAELHSANMYLINQFLSTESNVRTDNYGGSVENRCRFGLEVMDALVAKVGAEKVGIRLSPFSTFQGPLMPHADTIETYTYYVTQLAAKFNNLAYIHVVESRIAGNTDCDAPEGEDIDFLYNIWAKTGSVFITAGGITAANAEQEVVKRPNSIVAIGRYFISNSDLVNRIKHGQPLRPYNRDTFYLYGPDNTQGYTDYTNYVAAKA